MKCQHFGLKQQKQKKKYASSNSESRKLIRSNGVKFNRETVKEELSKLTINELKSSNQNVISVGKKKHFKIEVIQPNFQETQILFQLFLA